MNGVEKQTKVLVLGMLILKICDSGLLVLRDGEVELQLDSSRPFRIIPPHGCST